MIKAYTILERISVNNWYCGQISALHAFANACTISSADVRKVRYHLKKHGFKTHVVGNIIQSISKL